MKSNKRKYKRREWSTCFCNDILYIIIGYCQIYDRNVFILFCVKDGS